MHETTQEKFTALELILDTHDVTGGCQNVRTLEDLMKFYLRGCGFHMEQLY